MTKAHAEFRTVWSECSLGPDQRRMAAMSHALATLGNGAVLLFVVTTMLAMGFSLTVAQILAPLRRVRLVVLALVANFVLVPLLAFALTHIIPLSDPLKIGLI